jgi:hypothetical protein
MKNSPACVKRLYIQFKDGTFKLQFSKNIFNPNVLMSATKEYQKMVNGREDIIMVCFVN